MSTIQDCPFCNLSNRVLRQNDRAVLFLSNPRKMPGHCLVTPKRHTEKPWELTSDELLDVFELIAYAQKRLLKHFAAGCDVRQNYRPFLHQGKTKVDHVHYHIIPRDFEEVLYEKVEKHEAALFENLSDEEYTKIAKLIA